MKLQCLTYADHSIPPTSNFRLRSAWPYVQTLNFASKITVYIHRIFSSAQQFWPTKWSDGKLQIPLLNLATGKEVVHPPSSWGPVMQTVLWSAWIFFLLSMPYKRRVIECVDCFLNCTAILLRPSENLELQPWSDSVVRRQPSGVNLKQRPFGV